MDEEAVRVEGLGGEEDIERLIDSKFVHQPSSASAYCALGEIRLVDARLEALHRRDGQVQESA